MRLIETLDSDSLAALPDKLFNVAVAMETMEHIPELARGRYLAQLARIVDGVILITAPAEKGPVSSPSISSSARNTASTSPIRGASSSTPRSAASTKLSGSRPATRASIMPA